MASAKNLPILNEAIVKLALGQHPLMAWVFVANVTDESSWDLMSCVPTMCPWIRGVTCYNWVLRKFHCSALGRDNVQTPSI
jgi:hypothetical protein